MTLDGTESFASVHGDARVDDGCDPIGPLNGGFSGQLLSRFIHDLAIQRLDDRADLQLRQGDSIYQAAIGVSLPSWVRCIMRLCLLACASR